MAVFTYQAKKGPDELLEGQIEAENEEAALSKLNRMGYYPVSLIEGPAAGSSRGAGLIGSLKAPSRRDVVVFTRQLSDLLEAGLPVFEALDVLRGQTENQRFRRIIEALRQRLEHGDALSESLAGFPHVFSDLYVNMVRSGEVSGALEEVLKNLADFLEREEDIRARIRSSMAYPALVVGMSVITILVLMTLVIPKLAAMFQDLGQELPLPTEILVGITGFLVDYGLWILAVAAVLYLLTRYQSGTGKGRLMLDGIKLRLPGVGKLLWKIEIVRFARTLSILLRNGVPMVDSLDIAGRTVQNGVIRSDVERVRIEVTKGERLGKSLGLVRHFPGFVINVISVGEESNFLERALNKVADSYEKEVDRTVKVLTSLLEPVVTAIMGGIVGMIVLSIMLAIFRIDFTAR
jgi:type II secretory pathway component PulF